MIVVISELLMSVINKDRSINGGNKMTNLPHCPKCHSEYTYEDGNLLVCPECAYEWILQTDQEDEQAEKEKEYRDSNGNVLVDGDSVTVIKDLKVKGNSLVVKKGTKVKDIKLIDEDHDIDCRVPGIGPMKLKTEFVKKI